MFKLNLKYPIIWLICLLWCIECELNWIGIERKWIELELNWKILNPIWIRIELNWKILNPTWIGIELNWKKWIDSSPKMAGLTTSSFPSAANISRVFSNTVHDSMNFFFRDFVSVAILTAPIGCWQRSAHWHDWYVKDFSFVWCMGEKSTVWNSVWNSVKKVVGPHGLNLKS